MNKPISSQTGLGVAAILLFLLIAYGCVEHWPFELWVGAAIFVFVVCGLVVLWVADE